MKTIHLLTAFAFLVLNTNTIAQTPVDAPAGTDTTIVPTWDLNGTAHGNPGGRDYVYSNLSWPDYVSTCYIFGFNDTLYSAINGNNLVTPPTFNCSGLTNVIYDPILSNLSNGELYYAGVTTYKYIAGGSYVVNTNIAVRVRITFTDGNGLPISAQHYNSSLLIAAVGDFNVNVIFESLSPAIADYAPPGVADTWTPSISLFDYLSNDPATSICTSIDPGSFYSFIVGTVVPTIGDYCEGEDIYLSGTISGANVTFDWSGPNVFTSTDLIDTIFVASVTESGDYILEVINDFGCPNRDTTTVTVHALPNVVANANEIEMCDGDTLILTGGGAISYSWDNSVTDGVGFVPALGGPVKYIVTGTDGNTCENIDSVEVTVLELPDVVASANETVLCEGDSLILTAAGAVSYSWDNGVINGIGFVPTGGTVKYIVTGTGANTCLNLDSVEVLVNTVDATVTTTDPSITANASNAIYQWLICEGDNYSEISGEIAQNFDAIANGTYAVMVEENGCIDTSECIPIVTVGIDANSFFEDVSIFPNPTQESVSITLGSLNEVSIKVYSIDGQIVYQKDNINTSIHHFEFNEASGVYFLEVIHNGLKSQYKLIKE